MQLFHEHEQVVVCHEPEAGLRAIIAVHDTTLGPALGGIRMWRYDSDEAALTDVLRLSRGMTYKNSAAGLDLGGGKTVVLGDPRTEKTPLLFRALGRFIDSLGGRYLAAEDVGTSTDDAEIVALETDHITGLPVSRGGSGDPSPMTAWGVFCGMRAAAAEAGLGDDLRGARVAVQGAGMSARASSATCSPPAPRSPSPTSTPSGSSSSSRSERPPARPTRCIARTATCSRRARSAPSSSPRRSPSCAAASSQARPTTSCWTARWETRSTAAASCMRPTS